MLRWLLNSKGGAAVQAAFWSVLATAYVGALLTQAPGIYDEGLIVTGADRVLHSELPYRDFNTGYPPAQFYTIALVFKAFGATLFAERVWDTLWRLAIIAMAVMLAQAATPGQRAYPLLVCAGLVTGAAGFHLYPMITAMLPCLAAVYFAAVYLTKRGVRWLFFSGITAGIAALYRHDLAACVCGAVTVTICYRAMTERKRNWLRFPAVFSASMLLVIAPPAWYFASTVPRDALAQSFIDFPRMNLVARHLPLPGPWPIEGWYVFYLPLAVILAAAITLRRVSIPGRAMLVLLLAASVFSLALATQRLDTVHSYPAILFSLVLLCTCIPLWRGQKRRLLPNALVCAAAFCYGLLPLFSWNWQLHDLRQASRSPGHRFQGDTGGNPPFNIGDGSTIGDMSTPAPKEIARARHILLTLGEQQAILFVQRHLLPGKPLYVGPVTHGLAFNNDALFYFLADRPPATRINMVVSGITNGAVEQSEMLRDIQRKRTECIVLFRPPPSHEQNLSSVDSGVHILDDAIRREYTQVAEFGRYTIWQRKNMGGDPGDNGTHRREGAWAEFVTPAIPHPRLFYFVGRSPVPLNSRRLYRSRQFRIADDALPACWPSTASSG